MEWSRIKHFNSMIQIQYNCSDQDSLPEFSRTMPIMKFLEFIRDHLRNKSGTREIPLSYIVRARVVPDSVGDISKTLPYSNYTGGFHEEQISCALHTNPEYDEDNAMAI